MKKQDVPQITQENSEETAVVREESKVSRIISTVINVILVISIILAAVCTYVSYVSTSGSGVPSLFGLQVFSIQTDSMYPTLLPGDLIIDTAVKDTGALRKGDIITYWTVINGERTLNTHAIHEIYDGGEYLIFATKGHNNTAADPLTVHESEVVGQYKVRIPGVGKFFDYLQTSTGFLLVVVIPVFIFFLFHLVQFFRVLFEYQNVKNRLKYEQERGRTEDFLEQQKAEQEKARAQERAALEAELREKLRAELMGDMAKKEPEQAEPAESEEAAAPAESEEIAETAEAPEQAESEAAAEPVECEETAEPAEGEETAEPAQREEPAQPAEEAPQA
jgi:signal peptidase